MSRTPAGMIALALAALLAIGPATAYADQFTDANLHRAEVNARIANQNARFQAEHPGARIGTAGAIPPRGGVRRDRTVHVVLDRQASELSHRVTR